MECVVGVFQLGRLRLRSETRCGESLLEAATELVRWRSLRAFRVSMYDGRSGEFRIE